MGLLQHIVNGLLLGGILALVGLGFSLVWGILNIVNLAHGAFIMLAAYLTWFLFTWANIDPFLAMPLTMATLFIIGYLLQYLLINRILGSPLLVTFLLTFGLETILNNTVLLLATGNQQAVTPAYSGAGLSLGGVEIPYIKLGGLALAIILTGLVYLFMNRTQTGRAIRAVGMDNRAALLMGINLKRIYALTFGIGAAIAAAAGTLLAVSYPFTPTAFSVYNIRAFAIVVFGGLGSIEGALLGGLAFGLIEELGSSYVPQGTGLREALVFAVLVLLLIFRPRGLRGKAFYQ